MVHALAHFSLDYFYCGLCATSCANGGGEFCLGEVQVYCLFAFSCLQFDCLQSMWRSYTLHVMQSPCRWM